MLPIHEVTFKIEPRSIKLLYIGYKHILKLNLVYHLHWYFLLIFELNLLSILQHTVSHNFQN